MSDCSKSIPEEAKFITKKTFLDYFRKPYPFWFLQDNESEDFFTEKTIDEELENIDKLDDLYEFLREIDSDQNLFLNNFFRLSNRLKKDLLEFYKRKFKLPTLAIYDFSGSKGDITDFVLDVLRTANEAFIFCANIIVEDIKINPTIIYKYAGHIYLIEHFGSTSLKREFLAHFSFYNYVLSFKLGIKVDQYFVSYLSDKVSPNKELMIEITNSIPFKTKKVYPTDILDLRLANVNAYFDLPMSYEDTLYEVLYTKDIYDSLMNKDFWEEKNLICPDFVIGELRRFMNDEDRTIDFRRIASGFLVNKVSVVSSESTGFKFIFSNIFENFNFSGNLVRLDKVVSKILGFTEDQKSRFLLSYIENLKFLDFPEDQDYIVFEEAENHFKTLSEKKIKIYYDFETISFPVPYLENTKPYTQIVLQMSLIRVKDNREENVVNLIVDPLEICLDDFKGIIDSIYTDEPEVAYIVYNKSFENSRLKEMACLIDEPEYMEKVVSIIDRTIDLANWFSFGNNPFIIHRQLKGFHSIKKVVKLVSKEIEEKTGVVQYSDLRRCQNGLMAQSLLMSRALSDDPKADEKNWNKNKEFMYRYCENDVRSMMAVEILIKELLDGNKYGFYDLKKYLEEKKNFKRTF